MNFTLYQIAAVIILHFAFDFVLQSHWMASNKSKSNKALLSHVSVYSIGLVIIAMNCLPPIYIFPWIIFNAVAHFVTDYFTSRASSKLFNKDWHNFFCIIGADQAIHYMTLFGSMKLMVDYL
jgi:hypothetical protein